MSFAYPFRIKTPIYSCQLTVPKVKNFVIPPFEKLVELISLRLPPREWPGGHVRLSDSCQGSRIILQSTWSLCFPSDQPTSCAARYWFKGIRRTTVLLDVGQRRSGKILVTVWRANT